MQRIAWGESWSRDVESNHDLFLTKESFCHYTIKAQNWLQRSETNRRRSAYETDLNTHSPCNRKFYRWPIGVPHRSRRRPAGAYRVASKLVLVVGIEPTAARLSSRCPSSCALPVQKLFTMKTTPVFHPTFVFFFRCTKGPRPDVFRLWFKLQALLAVSGPRVHIIPRTLSTDGHDKIIPVVKLEVANRVVLSTTNTARCLGLIIVGRAIARYRRVRFTI